MAAAQAGNGGAYRRLLSELTLWLRRYSPTFRSYGRGDVWILAGDQPVHPFHDRHVGAKDGVEPLRGGGVSGS